MNKYTKESLNDLAKALNNHNNIYDRTFLVATLDILEADIKDLSLWSAYNDDKLGYEIFQLERIFKEIKEQI